MSIKYVCGMLTGLAVGAAAGVTVKCVTDKREMNSLKKKAKKMLNKMEKYVGDTMEF